MRKELEMNKTLFTLLTATSLTHFVQGDDKILVPEVHAIVLTGSSQLATSKDIEGVTLIDLDLPGDRERLEERLLPLFMDKPLSIDDITNIKREIILFYRDNNRPIVAIQIPEQDVTDGVLTFQVTEGSVGEISVEGAHYFSKKLIRNYITLEPGEKIDESILLNNLNFINRNPFRHADLVYSPGTALGTTNLEVYVRDYFPLRVYVGVDNTGLEATDRTRLYTGFNWGKAFGLDHLLSFQYTTSPDFYKFQGYTLSYTMLLPWEHTLLVYGGYSATHVKSGSGKNKAKVHGRSTQGSFRYGIPVKPHPHLLHEFNIGYDFKRTNNSFDFSEQEPRLGDNVNLTQFVLEYNFGYEKGIQKAGFDVELFVSPFSWLPNQAKTDFQSLNPHAKPQYAYALGAIDYTLFLPRNFQCKLFFEAQVASGSLLPSEQFGLGGYNTVRGYNERQVNTDEGFLFTAEFWSPAFSPSFGLIGDNLQFLIFWDYGVGHDIDKIPHIKQTQWLMGIGPGLRYAITPYLSGRLDIGFKLHRNGYEGGIGMAHFALIGSF